MDVKLIFEDSATLQSNGSFQKIFRPPLPALSPTGMEKGVYMGLQPMLRFEASATVQWFSS